VHPARAHYRRSDSSRPGSDPVPDPFRGAP
jgi:hypothetical protein